MKSKLTMATALLAQTVPGLSQASADPLCSTIITLQPIEYEFQQPILIDSFFPANTDIVIDDDLVVHVTNAPTSLSTVLTDVSRSLTTLTSAVNGNPPDGGFITFTVSADPRDIGNHPVTKTYPATEPGQPDVVVIQVPTSTSRADDLTTSSVPYDTITTTGDFPSLTGPATKTVTPDGPGQTGSVIVEVPNTKPGGSSASYVRITSSGDLAPTDDPLTSTISPSGTKEPGTVIVVVSSSQVPSNSGISVSSVPYVTITITTTGSLDPTDDPITKTVSSTGSAGSGTVIVEVPPSSSPNGISNTPSNPISSVTLTVTGDNGDGDTSTTSVLPTASDGTGTVIVEVPPPTNSPSSTIPSDSSSENINNPSSTVPGDSSAENINPSATGSSASQEPSDTAIPSSTNGDNETTSGLIETSASSPSQSTTNGNVPTSSASEPAGSSETSEDTQSETPSSPASETSGDSATSTEPLAPSSTSSPNVETDTTASPASSDETTPISSTTESAPSSASTEEAVDYDPCPDSLYGNPQCCSVDVLGVADIECDSPTESPTDADSFAQICATSGQRARCCVLPVLGQALVCMTPVGVAN